MERLGEGSAYRNRSGRSSGKPDNGSDCSADRLCQPLDRYPGVLRRLVHSTPCSRFVRWKSPFGGKPLYVSFEKTRVFVFWSKNPAPFFPHLDLLDRLGYGYYFLFTLNDYDAERLEPGVPPVGERIETSSGSPDESGKAGWSGGSIPSSSPTGLPFRTCWRRSVASVTVSPLYRADGLQFRGY